MAEEVKAEEHFINLLLTHKDLVEDFLDSKLDRSHFNEEYLLILHAIEKAYDEGVLLTRKSYLEFLNDFVSNPKEASVQERKFNLIYFKNVDKNDYPMLKKKILESFLVRNAGEQIKKYTKDCRDGVSIITAINRLSSGISDLSNGLGESKKIVYDDILNFSEEFVDRIKNVREGNEEEAEIVSTGFSEIDYSMQIGLAPGTLTLFCADVGGFKSTLMLNVALNAWLRSKKNVLFVPLEMPKDQIFNKMISRETRIPFEHIAHPKLLSQDQMDLIEKTTKETWVNFREQNNAKFYIMDSFEDRVKVSTIKRQIDRHIQLFKPDVIVVDYVGNLETDKNRDGRNDLEIGDMLKSMRHMGKKGVCHDNGFAIVSGAQLGRESLKRARRSSSDKMHFHSEDIRGSHEYAADADNIYVLFVDPQQPSDKLQIFPVKNRYGRSVFQDGQKKACLDLRPEISMISSSDDFYSGDNAIDVLQKISEEDDSGFSQPVKETQTIVDVADDFEW